MAAGVQRGWQISATAAAWWRDGRHAGRRTKPTLHTFSQHQQSQCTSSLRGPPVIFTTRSPTAAFSSSSLLSARTARTGRERVCAGHTRQSNPAAPGRPDSAPSLAHAPALMLGPAPLRHCPTNSSHRNSPQGTLDAPSSSLSSSSISPSSSSSSLVSSASSSISCRFGRRGIVSEGRMQQRGAGA